jgi:hypothetical protein
VGVQHGDGAGAWLAPTGAAAYARPVLTVLSSRVDRRIADVMLARARRRWPLHRLEPRTCARQLLLPAATLARQDLARCRRARRDARWSGAPTDPGCLMLKAQPDRLRVESSTDAFVCASWELWVPAAHRACFWAIAQASGSSCGPDSDERFRRKRSRGSVGGRCRCRIRTLGASFPFDLESPDVARRTSKAQVGAGRRRSGPHARIVAEQSLAVRRAEDECLLLCQGPSLFAWFS